MKIYSCIYIYKKGPQHGDHYIFESMILKDLQPLYYGAIIF